MKLYEGMFLLDNQAVRADWAAAKAAVTGALAKHGAQVKTARRWDERRLAYTIKGRKRATYLLTYFEQDADGAHTLRRDLEIDERILRYLITATEEVPEGELEASQAELEAGFQIPTMPGDDDATDETEVTPDEDGDSSDDGDDSEGDGDDDESSDDEKDED